MLDLEKSYGQFEGVVFYGDHQDDNIVYYFPDEIRPVLKDSSNEEYEFLLQISLDRKIRNNDEVHLKDNDRSILQLTVNCEVNPERLERAFAALKKAVPSIPRTAVTALPSWTDGSVDLITVNSTPLRQEKSNESTNTVVSHQRPSLLGSLRSVFYETYDMNSTDMLYSAIKHDRGLMSMVNYDLAFTAIRPALDLKMTAYLSRCQETVRKNFDAELRLPLGKLKLDLSAQFEWLTQKMMDNCDIVIEGVTQSDTPEQQKLIDELVNDFTDKVLKEILSPTVVKSNSMGALANALAQVLEDEAPIKIGLFYTLKDEKISDDRIITADYTQRCAVTRPHNPNVTLSDFFGFVNEHFDHYVKIVNNVDLFKTQDVTIKLSHSFEKIDNDLECVDIIFWKHKDGVLKTPPKNGYAIPPNTLPLGEEIHFTAQQTDDRRLEWRCDTEEDRKYYYQIKFTYKRAIDHVYSPVEMVSPPLLSEDRILIIAPNAYMFYKNIPISVGNLDFGVFSSAVINFEIKNDDGETIHADSFELKEKSDKNRLIVRRKDYNTPDIWMSKTYYSIDNNLPILNYPLCSFNEAAVIVEDPRKIREIEILIQGNRDGIEELVMDYSVISPVANRTLREKKPLSLDENVALDDMIIKITYFTTEDTIKFSITKKMRDASGKLKSLRSSDNNPKLISQLDDITIDLDI